MDPHLTPAWFDLLERTALPPGTKVVRVPIGPDDDRKACLLPLMRLSTTPWRMEGLSTFYSPIFGPIGEASLNAGALCMAFSLLRNARRAPTAILDLSPMNPNEPFISIAQQCLRASGWLVDPYFRFGNWFARIDSPDFERYWAERPSALRNTLKRARKKLQAQTDFESQIIDAPGPLLERAIENYTRVYARSWKRPEPYPNFIPALCRLAADQGWLRLGLIRLNGQPVASQIWLVASGCAQIVKLAYDPDYRHLSVGTLLTADLMRYVIEKDRVEEVDYLIGDDPYKRDWTPQRRERYGLVAFNPTLPRGLALAARHYAGRLWRYRRRPGLAMLEINSVWFGDGGDRKAPI